MGESVPQNLPHKQVLTIDLRGGGRKAHSKVLRGQDRKQWDQQFPVIIAKQGERNQSQLVDTALEIVPISTPGKNRRDNH